MADPDLRPPKEVTADFHRRMAEMLVPLGFVARARNAAFVRKRGKSTHRVELSSSHLNVPGNVAGDAALWFEDAAVRKQHPGWQAGGGMAYAFADTSLRNVARAAEADALARWIVDRLGFFDLLDDPAKVLAEVCRRYVAGLYEPYRIMPYLLTRLGPDAVRAYAGALLDGRPELWSAFASPATARAAADKQLRELDHGTQLAATLAAHGVAVALEPPPGTVRAEALTSGSLRSFFGLQLRAWGEPEAAGQLRRVDDAVVHGLNAAWDRLPRDLVSSAASVQPALQAATGEARMPRRAAASPRSFQYAVLAEPFAP